MLKRLELGKLSESTEIRNEGTEVELIESFEHAVSIWWTVPHSVTKRTVGSKELEEATFIEQAEILAKKLGWTGGDVECREFIPASSEHVQSGCCEAMFKMSDNSVLFVPFCAERNGLSMPSLECPYLISLSSVPGSGKFYISVDGCLDEKEPISTEMQLWVTERLLPKLVSWTKHSCWEPRKPVIKSLVAVGISEYTDEYRRLKKLYGQRIVEQWTEQTDPQKFVYEDIAIAAYLMSYWRTQTESPWKGKDWFLDVGCGNGLLCYIFALEKMHGLGVDLRRRKIWSQFKEEANLKEMALDPSQRSDELADSKWLIGNHSDELTPWIPVMAARKRANFFLLPCCAWDFYGKYKRRQSGKSKYRCYLGYVKELSEQLGFEIQEDRLKIPSTKRMCLIGTFTGQLDEVEIEERISHLLEKSKGEFEPRDSVIPVNNCTRVDQAILDAIVGKLIRKLAEGTKLPLEECAELLSDSEKKALRGQGKGVQTLLKNHGAFFQVQKGRVQLVDAPMSRKEGQAKRQKECCFWKFHPKSCPLSDSQCMFQHAPV